MIPLAYVIWLALLLYFSIATAWAFKVCWLVSGSIVTFFVYGIDKRASERGLRRISVGSLLLMTILGGFVGAALGMIVWHHKFRHIIFYVAILLGALWFSGALSDWSVLDRAVANLDRVNAGALLGTR